jgi:xylulokinase
VSFLGIDVGTTGCKAVAFSETGDVLGSAYREYDAAARSPGWAELVSAEVWGHVKACVAEVAATTSGDPIAALCVSSLGEAVVPVTKDRAILGPSILNFDSRGAEELAWLAGRIGSEELYATNGNTLGNHYSLTKIMWLRAHEPGVWDRTDHLLHWSGFVSFMMGADPHVDFSLANRTLLFDIHAQSWSERLLRTAGLDAAKLPRPVASCTEVGKVADSVAKELGLPRGVRIVAGAHDQCCNAVGCGVTEPGSAMYGMGTYLCIVPVYEAAALRAAPAARRAAMMRQGLNTEHHAAPGRFVSFVYNQGGALVKWYRDTFAVAERRQAVAEGRDVYPELFAELPEGPSSVLVLPHFTVTGPPRFVSDSAGLVAGLTLATSRGDILKGVLEGSTYYLKECVDGLPEVGIDIRSYRAVGGGSRSDAWVGLSADIMNRPFHRPRVTEAGALGAAIMAATGTGGFGRIEEGALAMVHLDREFLPDPGRNAAYTERFERYREMEPLFHDFLRRARVGARGELA